MTVDAVQMSEVQSLQEIDISPTVEKRPTQEAPKADFSSVGSLRQTAPALYDALIVKGFGQAAVIQAGREEQKRRERAKKMQQV